MPKESLINEEQNFPLENAFFDKPEHFLNREISWLKFNERVLEEAEDERNPLLERIKFLAIFASNLDEFFMIRVSGLRKQLTARALNLPPDGLNPMQQLVMINQQLNFLLIRLSRCWHRVLRPQLRINGINVANYSDLTSSQKKAMRLYFVTEIYPVLTPLAVDPGHPFPHISNLSLNLAIVIKDGILGKQFARLKVPKVFPRLLSVPGTKRRTKRQTSGRPPLNYVWIEEVIAANLDLLFPGMEIISSYPFRITRDADIEIQEDEASDLLLSIQESIEMRRFGSTIRLEINKATPDFVRKMLEYNLNITPHQVYTLEDPIGKSDLMELTKIDRPDLKDKPFFPSIPNPFAQNESIFEVIRNEDQLLYHPYDNFAPVVDFLNQAAIDPNVLAIKQTLYRVGNNSPIIHALLKAREDGKQVAVLVELKARFDEEKNIVWAQELERAGVHVTYGVMGLKTHAKMCMVVRKENNEIVRYIHLGTGNYNVTTSLIYSDISFFTADPAIGADVADLFNAITGYSRKTTYRKLLVAPNDLRKQLIDRVMREIKQHRISGNGYLAFKMNSLVDKQCILALYQASQAGVKIDLQVRGICCLVPGLPGVSENIRVTSIVGRFLEHTRIYYFHNNGQDELLLGSADLMPRNLDRRIETLFPITNPDLRKYFIQEILQIHLHDNVKSRELNNLGEYSLVKVTPNEPNIDSQIWILEKRKRPLGECLQASAAMNEKGDKREY